MLVFNPISYARFDQAMHPRSKLESLPRELLDDITSYLEPHHLAQLSYTCKYLSQHVESLLWENVELHKPGYHASSIEPNSAPPIRPASYFRWLYEWTHFLRASHRAEAFFTMLQRLHRDDPEHFQRLARRVKSFCTVIQPDWQPRNTTGDEPVQGAMIRFWQLLPFFKNLEKLELHGDISESEDYEGAPEITAPPLQLRVAKLFGYIPRGVAAWLLKSGNTLEWLELGLLHWSNFPTDGDEELFPPPGDTSEDYDIDPNDEYFETVIPQPLVNFLPSSRDFKFRSEMTLPRLKHLHLCQPCKGSYGTHEVSWSISAQAQCLSDWREILLACSDTLAVLVLEQRPSIDLRGVDEQGADEVKVLENDEDGGRHRALIKMVQGLFTSEEALKMVKQVYLHGMVVGQDELGNPTDRFASGRFMRLLESGGVKCEARQGHWFMYDEDYTEYAKYMEEVHGTEETEDNGEFDFMCKQTPFLARV